MDLNENNKLLTIIDISRILNVKVSWVKSAIFKRKIPYIKVGHYVRFDEKEIESWIKRHKIYLK